MSQVDWIILVITLLFIVLYGIWKSRGTKNIEGFLLADKQLPWYHVGLSVMATQASAITFISAPGQAYSDGLRFIQFYFGLPLAMVVLCITFIPIFHRLNVYTAYEYLEKRFDIKTRSLTALLFLLQRGLSTGITIYAPSIVLSTILNIDINYTTLITGTLVIIYTVYGGLLLWDRPVASGPVSHWQFDHPEQIGAGHERTCKNPHAVFDTVNWDSCLFFLSVQ
ncbi:MAG: sodium:solute symporter [Bacteroidetes bacterium]|nr:sodium:solute symporter [Bacteroidota bacterium]